MSLPTRKIGQDDVTAMGYGAMGIAAFYGTPLPDEERFKILDAVYANGCTNWDTADIYADSEALIGKWFKRTGKRNEIFLATKFGYDLSRADVPEMSIRADPEYVPQALNKSLERLGVDHIDLWYLHRADRKVPIELTVRAMAEQVKAGKVKYLGLSEVTVDTLRRAHAVHPISALQVEYSPFALDIEDEKIGLLKAARELGITIVAYSPVGRGLLTGKIKSPDDLEENDGRRYLPRFSKENFPKVLQVVDSIKAIAQKYNATPAQISLAWLLAQGEDVIPIPGTTKVANLQENLGALKVKLAPEDVAEIRKIAVIADKTVGPRYHAAALEHIQSDTPPLKE
ncbi:Aldo/keto reductase [Cubamyces lactineus]|nr:Aldo/keto reductase [Cubamyces lactineus]